MRDGSYLKGLSEFSKSRIENAAKNSIKLIEEKREAYKDKEYKELRDKINKRNSSFYCKIFPSLKDESDLTDEYVFDCLEKEAGVYGNWWFPSWEYIDEEKFDSLNKIIKHCELTESEMIYLDGNDVDLVFK